MSMPFSVSERRCATHASTRLERSRYHSVAGGDVVEAVEADDDADEAEEAEEPSTDAGAESVGGRASVPAAAWRVAMRLRFVAVEEEDDAVEEAGMVGSRALTTP